MLSWHFKKLDPDYPDDATLAQKNFRRESTALPEIFVRELVQNVLDARTDAGGPPAKVSIKICALADQSSRGVFKEILEPLEPHLIGAEHNERRDFDNPTVLIVEEFGTRGLTGNVKDSRAKGATERWANFWHGEGKRSKRGKELGRAGQGKITYHMASAAQTVLAHTMRGDNTTGYVFGKCIVQKSHDAMGQHYMRHGYWRRTDPALGLQPLPEENETEVKNFLRIFGLSQRQASDTGTSWVIPFPVPSMTAEAMTVAILKDFHFSILKGALEVNVCGAEINQGTAKKLIQKHIPDDVLSKQFLEFLEEVVGSSYQNVMPAKDDWDHVGDIISEASFETEVLQNLRALFEAGKTIGVRFPVSVPKKNGGSRPSHFDVFLKRPEGITRTEELYIRSDLLIGDEKWLRSAPGKAFGVMIAEDEVISEFLGYAEEASHLKWNAAEEDLTLQYDTGKARALLSDIRRALPRLSRLLGGHAAGVDENALVHILSVPDLKEGAKRVSRLGKKKKEKENVGEKLGDLPPPQPRPLRFEDIEGGIRISPGSDRLEEGQSIKIRFAYARVAGDGDPFKNYHPFDFDLSDEKQFMVQNSKGLEIEDRYENILKARILNSEFEIRLIGFSRNQRLVCRAEIGGGE